MTQRAPLTEAEKQNIQKLKASGMSLASISQELSCSFQTVRKWWRNGKKGLKVRPRGRPKRGALSTYAEKISQEAVEMKQTHPHWGAKKVRLELKSDLLLEEEQLPSAARLAALFKERCPEALQARRARLLPPKDPKVYRAHQRWQMDAKEHIPLGAERANVQEIRDVYSGLMIASRAFASPHVDKGWQRLRREDHQNVLRQAFCQWGLPLEVQTDNDDAFAPHTDADFPSLFTLWLVGLGIQHIRSRPHRPTDQAQVERNHRTQGDFVWKDQSFPQLELLQHALDHARQLYNEQYPSHSAHCHGRSPLLAFPTAECTGRPYHPDLEWELFDLSRVDAFLTRQVWTRKVACNGTVHVGSNYYMVGKPWVSQTIAARFLPDSRSFSFLTKDGSLIKNLPALDLDKGQIIGLIPLHIPLATGFQFHLPLLGV
jgi:transposase InsO family protein